LKADIAGHRFEIGAQLREFCRIAVQCDNDLGQRTDRSLLRDTEVLRAQHWREQGVTLKLGVARPRRPNYHGYR
jgi:hypothetical protein